LLGLGHIEDGFVRRPGNETQAAGLTRNLMYSGALNPDALLTPEQVAAMNVSKLARKFGSEGHVFELARQFIPGILRNL
jgi:hypothetical protein